jgi:choline dehydrogenase-like flavoprotein
VLIDARSVASGHTLRADVCIVGAGAAGLTIARELARHPLHVLVVESGQRVVRHATQRLYEGVISGRPYYPLDECRFRVLGGTTSQWGGWCRPLDAIDFEARDWLADSGWPFPKSELEGAYRRAQEVCGLGAYDYDARANNSHRHGLLPGDDRNFQDAIVRIRATRFGDAYGQTMRMSPLVSLLVNANVLEIAMDRTGRTATAVRAASLERNQFAIHAGTVVLAAGGIENARILLCSQEGTRNGVGNDHDLVGRYFSDHLHVPIGLLRSANGAGEFYRLHERDGVDVRGAISLTEDCRRRVQGLGFAVTLHDADDPHDIFSLAQTNDGYRSLQTLASAVQKRQRPDRVLHHVGRVIANLPSTGNLVYRRFVKRPARKLLIGCRAEQAPNPESRVTLDRSRDELGVPRVRLDWRLSPQDLDSLRLAQTMLEHALRGQPLESFPFRGANGTAWEHRIAGGAHHMGTTRMHRDPRRGVVDEHCRVHGTTNLFVAGSSVFPTGGWMPPTLTVVALALRLADHLIGNDRSLH